jgi:hypothetical protein
MRPVNAFGGDAAYLPTTGQDIFDADDLPPVTAALRAAWGPQTAYPVASAEFAAAALVAVHSLELRLAALES